MKASNRAASKKNYKMYGHEHTFVALMQFLFVCAQDMLNIYVHMLHLNKKSWVNNLSKWARPTSYPVSGNVNQYIYTMLFFVYSIQRLAKYLFAKCGA